MKISTAGADLFHADGRTDGEACRNFVKAPHNEEQKCSY
jgi:hypothetical protein